MEEANPVQSLPVGVLDDQHGEQECAHERRE